MQKIMVNMQSLKEKLLEMEDDNVSLVELYLVPGQTENGSTYPAFLHLDGIFQNGEYKDYESIDEFSAAENLKLHKSA